MPPSYPEPRNLLKGKTVVVTAAAGTGIGFSAAKRATEEGATVLMSDFHERRLGEAADRIADEVGTRPATFVCDVTQQDHVDGLRDAALAALGHVDVLINNAGLGGEVSVVDMTDDQWSRVLDVTLNSVFRMTRSFLPPIGPIGPIGGPIGSGGTGRPHSIRNRCRYIGSISTISNGTP